MMLWAALGALTLAAVWFLLRPLLRASKTAPSRAAYDLEVYRDQLAELNREEARGLIRPEEARAAEREIARRLLAAAPAEASAATPRGAAAEAPAPGRAARRWAALGIATLVPLAALGLYLFVGKPGTPDFPFVERTAVPHAEGVPDMDEMIARLEARLKAKPGDLDGWLMLARSLATLQRYAEAEAAYAKAMPLSDRAPGVVAGYAEMMVMAAGGQVGATARRLFEEALAKAPESAPARFYLGLAKAQAGEGEAALRDWLALAASAPADAPWLPGLRAQIESTASEFKLDPATLAPPQGKTLAPAPSPPAAVAGAGTPGPSAADVAASANMTAAERSQMIRGMVERLAARLSEQPDDLDGWRRLARAYGVLGEAGKAADAEAHAAKLAATGPRGAPPATAPAPPVASSGAPAPGPSAADVAASANMTEAERNGMIRGMVERLAIRLREQPGDLDGWRRLGRAYEVLGEPDKAADALSHAAALAPRDADVQVAYGDALLARAKPGEGPPAQAVEVMRRVLALDGQRPEALWVVGLAEAARGDKAAAAGLFNRLLAQLAPETPQYERVKRQLDGLGQSR